MNSNNSLVQEQNISLASSKHLQLFAAAVLGLVILFGVGFAPMDMAHNAAHDTRHSVAFPCH
ncbi:MAG: CbtB-domain containing protein [Methyloprofundus sp.]|nr:CbtB-domain containing protein [Methyloprofundus sp.]